MNFSQLSKEDNAVSPVIGVILMVAITVILAAVIASFVLGMGPDTATTPTATFDSEKVDDGTTDAVVITMESGQTIDAENVEFSYETDGDDSGEGFENATIEPGTVVDINNEPWNQAMDADEITAGTSATLDFTSGFNEGETYTIRLVYVEGDTTSTLQTFEGTY